MIKKRTRPKRWVICISNNDYAASLELRKVYRRVPDRRAEADGWIRVVDESEEDYLYPADFFRPIMITPSLERSFLVRRRRVRNTIGSRTKR